MRATDLVSSTAAVILAGLVYVNALHNPFVYDDYRTILENASILSLSDPHAIVWHDVTRPLVNLSYAVDRRFWGPQPFGFHLTSVFLHALNTLLLFHLVRRLAEDHNARPGQGTVAVIRPQAAAFAAAALFAVHPLMTEAVGYISGRPEVLCATFCLSGMLSARQWMLKGGARWWLLALMLGVSALFTKETAVMFPFVLLCYDRLVLDGTPSERRHRFLRLHVPFLTIAILAGASRGFVFLVIEHPRDATLQWLRIIGGLDAVRRYVSLIVWPSGQTIFHVVPPITHVFELTSLAGIGAVGLLVLLAWWVRRRAELASFGVLWCLLFLAPSAALSVLGEGEVMAEHRVYLASCGLFLAAGAAFGWIGATSSEASIRLRWLTGAALAMTLLSLGGRTVLRNVVWSDPVLIWREAAERSPNSYLPLIVLGESLHAENRHEEAVAAYQDALRVGPNEETGYMKLGLCLAELGRFDEARATFGALRDRNPKSTIISTGLGMVSLMAGDVDQGRLYFRSAIDADSRDVLARQWLAVLEEDSGHPAEALSLCREVQHLVPGSLSTAECIRRNQARLAAIDSGRH